jgi:hypothetical protein
MTSLVISSIAIARAGSKLSSAGSGLAWSVGENQPLRQTARSAPVKPAQADVSRCFDIVEQPRPLG